MYMIRVAVGHAEVSTRLALAPAAPCFGFHHILYEKACRLKLSGNEVHFTVCALLEISKNPCSKLHCQNISMYKTCARSLLPSAIPRYALASRSPPPPSIWVSISYIFFLQENPALHGIWGVVFMDLGFGAADHSHSVNSRCCIRIFSAMVGVPHRPLLLSLPTPWNQCINLPGPRISACYATKIG